jgi:predicted nucleic acid-binding protein
VILVDTSVWAQHIRREVRSLSILLEAAEVLTHPFVIGEIAMGNLRQRDVVLRDLQDLQQAIVATDQEVLQLIDRNSLFGRGIGYVDAHLLAAARLSAGTLLWTFDKRLVATAVQLRLEYQPTK